MSASWTITQTNNMGRTINYIYHDLMSFGFTRVANDIGRWFLKVPTRGTGFKITDFAIDNLVRFDRTPQINNTGYGTKKTEFVGIITGRELLTSESGEEVGISGTCINGLLSRRIIAYPTDATQSQKTDFADNIICQIARENFGASSTDTARSMANFFAISPDVSKAPSVTFAMAWNNALDVMQKIADASATLGTDLYFGFDMVCGPGLIFWTRTSQPGIDRSLNCGVVLSPSAGNLSYAYYSENYDGEENYIYAGGLGTGADRYIATSYSTRMSGAWARREAFQDARGDTNAAVLESARERLKASEPIIRVGGTIVETPRFLYGVNWGFGDRLNINHVISTTGVIKAISVTYSNGKEQIDARIEANIKNRFFAAQAKVGRR